MTKKIHIPKDLDECIEELKKMLTPADIEKIKADPEGDLSQYHFSLGRFLRNNWGLWVPSPLARWFNARGIWHADDMSGIILHSLWRHLNDKPIQLEEQIKYYQDYWAKTGSVPMTLTGRRAVFVYNAARLAAIAAEAPVIPVPWDEREAAFKEQFLEVIERQCGPQRSSSPEELHGSWMQSYLDMGWVYGEQYCREKKIHPDLVPFAKLDRRERDKDAVFVALCEIARQWIYEEEG